MRSLLKQAWFICLIPLFVCGVFIQCFGDLLTRLGDRVVDLCSYLAPIEPPKEK